MVRACSGDIASTFSWKTFPELLLTCATKVGIVQISYQLSVISYQLPVISYQLSVISYQLSVISYQLSVISYQLPDLSFK
ncbi:MAG: hypothetical protein ACKPBT_09680 [Microcystis aeruginosa]